ncbi:protease modulator HflC [Eilatimonas milleporae]|uniref:Protein HflC n=1 Tax=Eilatimonas milleporae TaxID=911205 RepID=A0A3M0CQB7_9PROT|nr:protease modulator HflC [Eilatimonas milleporae]RMB11744.1 protease FtsH subunit HflC [Eilatimonas milleporae]
MNARLISLIVVAVIAVFVAAGAFFVIDERKQAIVVQFGEPKRTIAESGLHLKMPIFEQVILLEKRILSLDVPPQEVLASDQRRILVDSFARFRIVDPLRMYQAARTELRAADLLERIMQSAVRQILATQEMPAIVSGERRALMAQIENLTNERAQSIGLEVIDVRLKRVDLPPQNSQSIFQRMETERQREAAQARAEGQEEALKIRAGADREVAETLANAEREAQKIRGEADAVAVRVFAEAFGRDKEFFEFYRTMQAYRKALGKDDTTLVLSPDSEFFKLFMEAQSENR